MGVEGVEAAMALPHLLTLGCQEETNTVPEQADVLAEQAFQYLSPKERTATTSCRPFLPLHACLQLHASAWWRDVMYARRWWPRTYLTLSKALIGWP